MSAYKLELEQTGFWFYRWFWITYVQDTVLCGMAATAKSAERQFIRAIRKNAKSSASSKSISVKGEK